MFFVTGEPDAGHDAHGMVDGLTRHPGSVLLQGSGGIGVPTAELVAAPEPGVSSAGASGEEFLAVYDSHVDFVWRTARRLGVDAGSVDDVVQETFLVVHRRLGQEPIRSLRGWIYGIAIAVVRNHRRTLRRKSPHLGRGADFAMTPDELADPSKGPFDMAREAEANRLLHELLARLDDEKREVFVLVELEELSAPEVAEALGVNPNTVSSRLRLARAEFEEAARRYRARDEWRLK